MMARPGKIAKVFGGRIDLVPEIDIGRIGTPRFVARIKAPFLKVPISPVLLLVPSGKIITDVPSTSLF